jgi:hypothetical protein
MVMMKKNTKKQHDGDAEISLHKLGIRGWNPNPPNRGLEGSL